MMLAAWLFGKAAACHKEDSLYGGIKPGRDIVEPFGSLAIG